MKAETAISITRNYRINVTPHSWVVEKKEKGRWDIVKTYISLESLLSGFSDYLARQDLGGNTLKSYKEANKVVSDVIKSNQELILELANDSSKPVVRSSNTKLKITMGGTSL